MGFLPFIYKRPDRAFELIKLLRHYDKRFMLHLYGKMPQELPWLMKREDERRKFFDLLSNMRNYGDGIIFHGHQSSMAKIYEEMGWCYLVQMLKVVTRLSQKRDVLVPSL